MSATLTKSAIRIYVKRSLGNPVVEVELGDEVIDSIVDQALGIYGTSKPVEKFGSVSAIAEQQNYTLTSTECGRGVIEVFRPDLMGSIVSLDQFDVFKYHSFEANLDPGDFYAERVWWSEVRRSAGSDDDWEWFPDPTTGGGTIYISPPPSQSFTMNYIYVVDPSLTEVPPTDDDWILDYSLAMCMETLGRIRSKFTSVQGAESSIDMDGELLRQEGEAKRSDLEEYLKNRGQIIAPIRG